MSEFSINDIEDNVLKVRLRNKALELGIPVDNLIDNLICLGLNRFNDERSFPLRI